MILMVKDMISIAILVLVLATASIAAFAQGPGGEVKPKPSASPTPGGSTRTALKPPRVLTPLSVKIAKVQEQRLAETLNATGVLSRYDPVSVKARVTGRLEKVFVKDGAVKRGEVLAEIDKGPFQTDVDQATSALEQARAELSSSPPGSRRRIAAQHLAAQRQAALDNANQQLAACAIDSPVDGLVRNLSTSEGELVVAGVTIAVIERPNQLRVQVDLTNVKQREIQGEKIAIHEGQAARVNVGDSRYIGQVERVVSANGKLKSVEIAVPNYGYLTETEMTVRVEIDMDPSTVVTVPLSALVKSARASKLFVIESGKAAERMVTTGRRSPDWIEIKSGVRVGQSVIVNPAGLHSGQSVNATNQ